MPEIVRTNQQTAAPERIDALRMQVEELRRYVERLRRLTSELDAELHARQPLTSQMQAEKSRLEAALARRFTPFHRAADRLARLLSRVALPIYRFARPAQPGGARP